MNSGEPATDPGAITLSDQEYEALVATASKSGTAPVSWLSDELGGDKGGMDATEVWLLVLESHILC
jgi:hypothetical protein